MTGWYSAMDILEQSEAEMAAAVLNVEGSITINGQKYEIELVPEDIKSTLMAHKQRHPNWFMTKG